MSIILRQGCQHLLNEMELDFIHTDIQNKILTIVGECGQPLLPINGIKFGSSNPTKQEIGYAVGLFEKFLEKHGEQLQEFIAEKKKYKIVEAPIKPDSLKKYPNGGNRYDHTDNDAYRVYNKEYGFAYNSINKSSNNKNHITFDRNSSREEIKAAMEDDVFFEIADKFFKEQNEYTKGATKMNELRNNLNKCDI